LTGGGEKTKERQNLSQEHNTGRKRYVSDKTKRKKKPRNLYESKRKKLEKKGLGGVKREHRGPINAKGH